MGLLSAGASDQALLDLVREWVGLLAAEEYVVAFDLVGHSADWSPDLTRTLIRNYGSIEPRPDGRTCRVTPINDARGGLHPRHAVYRHGAVGHVEFDLPVDGEWSDLTALFRIEHRDGGLLLVLEDIHVL